MSQLTDQESWGNSGSWGRNLTSSSPEAAPTREDENSFSSPRPKRGLLVTIKWLLITGIAGILVSLTSEVNMPTALAQVIPAALEQGFTLLRQGRVLEAIKAFQEARERNPRSLEAKIGLAIAYRRQGLTSEAWQAYQNVLAQDPNNLLALKAVGLLATFRPQWQVQGIKALTTLLKLNPGDTEARGLRGLLYGYQQQFTEAIADYQIVLQSNPSPEVLLGAAETYTNGGNPQQGLDLFNRYQQATGKPITGYSAIAYARALRQTGSTVQAVRVLEGLLRTSTRLDDLAIQTRVALSRAYLANQQFTEARMILAPLQGRPDTVLPLARAFNEIRDAQRNQLSETDLLALSTQIATLYRQALAQTPNPDPRLLREVADIFNGLPGERPAALQIYRQLVAIFPNDRGLLVKQLALESQLGLITKSDLRSRLLAAVQSLPTNPVELREVAQSLASIDPPGVEFLPIYQNLLAAGVNLPFLNFRMAQLLIESNNLVGARSALAAYGATAEGAKDLAPQLLAAEIERREGNLEASAQRYLGLIASNRADQDILNAALQGLSGVRLQQNRPADAVAVFDQLVARNPQDLKLTLARASLAYRAKLISESQAVATLNYWLQTQPSTAVPPELFDLVGTLPADLGREPLYNALVQLDPNNLAVQTRRIQAIAKRSPAQARALVNQLVARDPTNISNYFLKGQIAQGIGELDLASQAYEAILAAEPNNVDALKALGGIRFEQRRFNLANELYSQAITLRPNDLGLRQTLISLNSVQDLKLEALAQLEQLQLEQIAQGAPHSDLSRQIQQLQEDFLQRRGFQPPWERY